MNQDNTVTENKPAAEPMVCIREYRGVLLLEAQEPAEGDVRLFQAGEGFIGLQDTRKNLGLSIEAIELIKSIPRVPGIPGGMLQWDKPTEQPDGEDFYYFGFAATGLKVVYHPRAMRLSENLVIREGEYVSIANNTSDDARNQVDVLFAQEERVERIKASLSGNGDRPASMEDLLALIQSLTGNQVCNDPSHDHSHDGIEHDPEGVEEPIEQTGEHAIVSDEQPSHADTILKLDGSHVSNDAN